MSRNRIIRIILIAITLTVTCIRPVQADQIDAVRVEALGIFDYRVVQQSDRYYVPGSDGVVAQYLIAKGIGDVLGFVAHDYLAGAKFYDLRIGDIIRVTFADGSVETFRVSSWQLVKYDGVANPYAVYYRGERRVTFQTCWGTVGWLFVVAVPSSEGVRYQVSSVKRQTEFAGDDGLH